MSLNNVSNINLKNHSYYSLKEYSYFMLANQIYKSQKEQKKNEKRISNAAAENQNLRSSVFRNPVQQKNSRNRDDILNSSMRSIQRGSNANLDNMSLAASEQKLQSMNMMN